MISLKNVKKTYPNGLTVMENMNIDIQDGSFTVLVGPSGCGKTTMIRMIAGLEEVTEGEIWIDDHDVTRVDPGERGIAMVFQNYALYSHMTVAKNISFGLKNYGYGKEEAKKITDEVLELVGLQDYANVKPGNLSGGQQQRVALARTLTQDPQIILADEPVEGSLYEFLRAHGVIPSSAIHDISMGHATPFVSKHLHTEVGDALLVLDELVLNQHGEPLHLSRQWIRGDKYTFRI